MEIINNTKEKISEMFNLESSTLNIGISNTLTQKYLLPYIKSFHEKYPNIIINIYTDTTKYLIKELKNGTIDLIISKFPQNNDLDLEYITLGKTKYIFTCNKDYIDLTNYSFETYEEFKLYSLSPKIGTEKFDSNISISEWEERWEFFYLLQEWTDFAYYLQIFQGSSIHIPFSSSC